MVKPTAPTDLVRVASVSSPFGLLGIETTVNPKNGSDEAITRLFWNAVDSSPTTSVLKEAVHQLEAYFAGTLSAFDLPLRVVGSDFQKSVCDAMTRIPFGETRTYGDLAQELDVAAQPIGRACGANPIPIIIPCHRVLGAGGKIVGFSGQGGVETKIALLRHEGAAGLLL